MCPIVLGQGHTFWKNCWLSTTPTTEYTTVSKSCPDYGLKLKPRFLTLGHIFHLLPREKNVVVYDSLKEYKI